MNLFPPSSSHVVLIGFPYHAFEDEGIDLLTQEESARRSTALLFFAEKHHAIIEECAVFTAKDDLGRFPWIVVHYGRDGRPASACKADDSSGEPIMASVPRESLPFLSLPGQLVVAVPRREYPMLGKWQNMHPADSGIHRRSSLSFSCFPSRLLGQSGLCVCQQDRCRLIISTLHYLKSLHNQAWAEIPIVLNLARSCGDLWTFVS